MSHSNLSRKPQQWMKWMSGVGTSVPASTVPLHSSILMSHSNLFRKPQQWMEWMSGVGTSVPASTVPLPCVHVPLHSRRDFLDIQ